MLRIIKREHNPPMQVHEIKYLVEINRDNKTIFKIIKYLSHRQWLCLIWVIFELINQGIHLD